MLTETRPFTLMAECPMGILQGKRAPGAWTREAIYQDGDAWYQAIWDSLSRARKSIWIETYMLLPDRIGQRLLTELGHAKERGCEVRLLVDCFGSSAWLQDVVARNALAQRGLAVRVWHPLPWLLWQGVPFQNRLRWLDGANRRDHRKICVVDEKEGWVGSLNWADVHSVEKVGKAAWHDVGARVRGPGMAALGCAFAHTWRLAWPVEQGRLRPQLRKGPPAPQISHPAVRVNHTFKLRRAYQANLFARLRHAKRRILITNAYFIPGRPLLRILCQAAARGVRTQILFPEHSDHAFLSWVSASLSDGLQKNGVQVFAYRGTMLHAKTMIIDDLALVGSHNLDARSFHRDLECELALTKKATLGRLEKIWEESLSHSTRLPFPAAKHLPLWKRVVGRLALLARYWF